MLMEQIKQGSIDAYDILGRYGAYLKSTNNISNLTLKQRVVTVKNFLEYHDVDISPPKIQAKGKVTKGSQEEQGGAIQRRDCKHTEYVFRY